MNATFIGFATNVNVVDILDVLSAEHVLRYSLFYV